MNILFINLINIDVIVTKDIIISMENVSQKYLVHLVLFGIRENNNVFALFMVNII